MAKRGKGSRGSAVRRPQERRTAAEPDLLDLIRAALDSGEPAALLGLASSLLAMVAEPADEGPTLDDLLRSFFDTPVRESSAVLLAVATLTGDADLLRRARLEIADRGDVLPDWLVELDRTRPVDRAVEITHVLGDGDDVLVGVTVPGGHDLTAVVLVDHNLGTVVTDGYVLQEPLAEVAETTRDAQHDPDVSVRDIPPADARARIDAALAESDDWPEPFETETWPETRPLLEWMVRLLPGGGTGYRQQDWSDEQLDELAERFLAGPAGARWAAREFRPLVDEVLGFGSANGLGDPLLWSPSNVEMLLVHDLPVTARDVPHLERAPDVLRDVVRFGHAERGIRAELTDETLAAVDEWTPAFTELVRAMDEEDGRS